MVMEVRVVSDAELAQRAATNQYIGLLIFGWIGAYLLDEFAIEPLIQWLAEGNWPVWWLSIMEMTSSVPAYVFGAEEPPLWLKEWGGEGAPWWANTVAWVMYGIGILCLIGMPVALMGAGFITFFLAIIAAIQAFWWAIVGLLILLFGGAALVGVAKGPSEK